MRLSQHVCGETTGDASVNIEMSYCSALPVSHCTHRKIYQFAFVLQYKKTPIFHQILTIK